MDDKSSISPKAVVTAMRDAVSRDGGYKYDLISAEADVPGERHAGSFKALSSSSSSSSSASSSSSSQRGERKVKAALGGLGLLAMLSMTASFGQGSQSSHHRHSGCEFHGNCTGDVTRIWGQYSPYFPVPSEIDPAIPAGCEVTFAQVLSRHGARWPTKKKSAEYKAVVDRIHSATTSYGAGYEFIKDYEYLLGSNDLTLLGQLQMVESGAAFFERYEALARDSSTAPFIRASGSKRVVMSAENFTRGFYERLGEDASRALQGILVLPETDEFNNTLDHVSCPGFEDGPFAGLKAEKQAAWRDVWAPPIKRRLDAKLRGANLSLAETVAVMDLCPFETVAAPLSYPYFPTEEGEGEEKGEGKKKYRHHRRRRHHHHHHNHNQQQHHIQPQLVSRFCELFTHDEWTSYDYHQSLDKYYGYGKGNPLGPSQGIGFGNELIARLTGQSVRDNTTTNRTLDGSPETFPLDRRLYADFSHDNPMNAIFAALGLFHGTHDLPDGHKVPPRETHGFSAAWAVPFSARMYVEKMRCEAGPREAEGGEKGEELVRVLLNDRVVPLKGCGMDTLGRCKLGAFVESLSFVRHGGLWGEC